MSERKIAQTFNTIQTRLVCTCGVLRRKGQGLATRGRVAPGGSVGGATAGEMTRGFVVAEAVAVAEATVVAEAVVAETAVAAAAASVGSAQLRLRSAWTQQLHCPCDPIRAPRGVDGAPLG